MTLNAQAAPSGWETTVPEVAIELRSYGEQPRDLVELLVPFVANLGFSVRVNSSSLRDPGINQALVRESDGDIVALWGKGFNCVVVEYFVIWQRNLKADSLAAKRAQIFETALDRFLRGLPAPRLSMHTLEWGSAYCPAQPNQRLERP